MNGAACRIIPAILFSTILMFSWALENCTKANAAAEKREQFLSHIESLESQYKEITLEQLFDISYESHSKLKDRSFSKSLKTVSIDRIFDKM